MPSNTYWVRTVRDVAAGLAAFKAMSGIDVNYGPKSDRRGERRRVIPAEKIDAQAAASAANLARLDLNIQSIQDRRDTIQTEIDALPLGDTRDRRRLNHLAQHEKTRWVRAGSHRAVVAGRDAQLDAELAKAQEADGASTLADAVSRWGGRASLDGLKFIYETRPDDPAVSGPGNEKVGDDAAMSAYIQTNAVDWVVSE